MESSSHLNNDLEPYSEFDEYEDSVELPIEDVTIHWISDPNKIKYRAARAIFLTLKHTIGSFNLYHAAMLASYQPYKTGWDEGEPTTPELLVHEFQSSLAKMLTMPYEMKATRESPPTHYETIHEGKLPALARHMREATLESVTESIQDPVFAGVQKRTMLPDPFVIEHLANIIGYGIIVIDNMTNDIHLLGCEKAMREFDSFIVLLFYRQNSCRRSFANDKQFKAAPGHGRDGDHPPFYTVVAILPKEINSRNFSENENMMQVKFDKNHPFIRTLFARADAVIEHKKRMLASIAEDDQ
jgi:hypothetical protein